MEGLAKHHYRASDDFLQGSRAASCKQPRSAPRAEIARYARLFTTLPTAFEAVPDPHSCPKPLYFTVEGMGVEKDGWYDEDMNLADNVPVPNGASLMFASQGTTSIQFSGAVSKSKIKVTTVDT